MDTLKARLSGNTFRNTDNIRKWKSVISSRPDIFRLWNLPSCEYQHFCYNKNSSGLKTTK